MENKFDKNKLSKNLSTLLKLFKDRPNHLAKYLIENNALKDDFIFNIINSKKLNEIAPNDISSYFSNMDNFPMDFSSFDDMETFYKSIIEEHDIYSTIYTQTDNEVEITLNEKLKMLLSMEDYEQATVLRDFMLENNIKINIY